MSTDLLGVHEDRELIVVNLPIRIDKVNPDGAFIANIKKELATDKTNMKLRNFDTKYYLSKKSKLGTVCQEQVFKNKKTGEIKKKYKILDLAGQSYEPVFFADFSYETSIEPNKILKIFEKMVGNKGKNPIAAEPTLVKELQHCSENFSSIAKPDHFTKEYAWQPQTFE